MRILIVHNFYRIPGGEDSVFRNEAELLKAGGNEVFTYTESNGRLNAAGLLFDAVFSRKTYKAVRELIELKDIEIVHVHNERFLISPSVFKAAIDAGIPVVQTLHNFRLLCINAMLNYNGAVCTECIKKNGVRFLPAIKRKCFRGSRLLTLLSLRINRYRIRHCLNNMYYIALTDFNRELFGRSLIEGSRIYVKPNFTPSFNDSPGTGERKGFLYLGRLDPLKGIEDILKEWEKLPDECILNIAGNGEEDYEGYLKQRYERKNIRFLGKLPGEEALSILERSKAMIFASRWYEGFPMTIIESFSKGTPVIGLDFGNAGVILKGIYNDPRALMKETGELCERILSFEEDRAAGLYDYSRDRLSVFGPDANYRLLMDIYSDILKRENDKEISFIRGSV